MGNQPTQTEMPVSNVELVRSIVRLGLFKCVRAWDVRLFLSINGLEKTKRGIVATAVAELKGLT